MRELTRQFASTQDLAKGIQPHKQVSFLSFFNNIYWLTLLMTILTFTWRKNKNNVQEIKEKYNITAHKQVSRVSRSIEFVISVQFSSTATCKWRFQQYVVLSPSDISHCPRCHLYDIRDFASILPRRWKYSCLRLDSLFMRSLIAI